MIRTLHRVLMAAVIFSLAAMLAAFPKPNPYPISWEVDFEHGAPKRLSITPRGAKLPEGYWYITYTVSNPTRDVIQFRPVFELMTEQGRIIRSDSSIPEEVVSTIRIREKNKHLLSAGEITGSLRPGADQAREGIAIWKEPAIEMGQFTIFVGGLSGEAVILKDDTGKPRQKDGKDLILFKTLELRYRMLGDDRYPGIDVVEREDARWIMR